MPEQAESDAAGPEGMYPAGHARPAQEIKLRALRQIWLWPLVLRLPADPAPDAIDRALRQTAEDLLAHEVAVEGGSPVRPWQEIHDLLDHAAHPDARWGDRAADGGSAVEAARRSDRAQAYGEFVYFHDYMQSVLFRGPLKRGKAAPLIRLFRRTDVSRLRVDIGDRRFRARVLRCNLYLFATGAATLAVEADVEAWLEGGGPLTLADAQTFIDQARRVYPPYFDDRGRPGQAPRGFDWFGRDDRRLTLEGWVRARPADPLSTHPALDELMPETAFCHGDGSGFIRAEDRSGRRSAPVAKSWQALVAPLVMTGYEEARGLPPGRLAWRHVVDERIPAMSYVSLTDAGRPAPPQAGFDSDNIKVKEAAEGRRAAQQRRNDLWAVRRGDWIRLCYADPPGDGPLPYAASFLRDFEERTCYDRFFPDMTHTSATRYLFAGYHTAVVGAGWFFDNLIRHHFRRHYFQMALMAQIELVSLLALSARVSEAVMTYREARAQGGAREAEARERFQRRVLATQREFLEFVHIFRFTGISNQIQATELFDRWRKSMGLDGLYTDVKGELEAATDYALGLDQKRQSESANRLSMIAALGFVLTLALSLLGMNVLLDGKTMDLLTHMQPAADGKPTPSMGWQVFANPRYFLHIAIAGGALAVSALLGWLAGRTLLDPAEEPSARRAFRLLRGVFAAGAAMLAGGLLLHAGAVGGSIGPAAICALGAAGVWWAMRGRESGG